ncbi:Replication-associated protein [Seminavis robusta]|uniref:Replication-associated protein n=1 Tax=Seminavis robusta TaxID=568900 RepID=A0A9N8ETY8_9STRA|nr:Replication-associated protein [Seminavis robusta]|eukprot:Sro1678_g290620.1 Replication-associated protein (276) ;mRNA; f:15710-16537
MPAVHKALGTKSIALLVASGTSFQAATYCKKGQQTKEEWNSLKESGPNHGLNFKGEEFGSIPSPGKRVDLDLLCEAVEEGKSLLEVSKIHPASYVRNYRGLANLQALNTKPYEHETARGVYYWGPPGTGKSHTARSLCPESLYIKPQSKWWDGYASESHVLLDDMDGNFLGHYLKIWADKYACTGEIKGGMVKLSHTTFIITSNYSIDSLWKDDPVMAAAIKRRFKVIHMTVPYMFISKPPEASPISKANHIFGTTPFKPLPTRPHPNPPTPIPV